jgi:class 3 adenylate cyclase
VALLVHANETVSTDRLVDVVWGDGLPPGGVDAPETRSARLHTLVSRLRATLADDRLETRPPGYRLRVGADELDALRFEECVRTGLESADRPEIAVAAFDDALSLWGGPPYAEFAEEEFVVSEVVRLLELHARAVEERAAALLQLDRPEDAVDQLESEILAQPFRERLRALSMLALARSGRAVESLRAYESFRVMLAEEIGVSPSAELQELNNEIARQDPAVSRSNVPETPASARGLPKGTLTFLFTDLESSTRLWEEHPQSMHEALARHDAILRDAIESHGGRVVKTTGDGALGVFESAHGALDAALAAQLALAEELWGENEALRVRMALHTGEAEERAGDYYGTAVNRAARLMSAGHGQQILTSQAAAQLMRDDLPPDVELIDLGVHRLRDVPTAERIFQVFHPDLPEHFPALLTVDGVASLPVPATSFHGRSGELAMLDGVLGRHGTVTLVGTGGVGKTRLAVEVAVQAGHQFRDGVAMVDLTPVGVDEVPATVAAGLGLVRRGRHSFRDSIVDWLRHKHFLLVIDNCEHVLPAAGQLVRDITETCAEVTVLATSRQPLGFSGETVFAVG